MTLKELIIQKIKDEGPISFRDFMEMALYYPGKGYYTGSKDKIGKKGDFYTSSNVSAVFGAMIGKQLEEMWEALGSKDFTIVEYGAGTGALCNDILDYLKHNPALYNQLKYCIIEKSPALGQHQQLHLNEKVIWVDHIEELTPITGCIISNEVLDNFSVHQVVMDDVLMEIFVDYKDGFVEVYKPAPEALTNYLTELNVILPKGFRTEINLQATDWIKELSTSLKNGYVITIDYGFTSNELYTQRRSSGTILCYYQHKVNADPYNAIGEQDITSHVNFSALCHWGFKNNLICCGLTNQGSFLLGLGFKEHLRKILENGGDVVSMAKKEAALSYTMLIDMGLKYKVLIQRKSVANKELSGLKL